MTAPLNGDSPSASAAPWTAMGDVHGGIGLWQSLPTTMTTVLANNFAPLRTVPAFLPVGDRPVPLAGGAVGFDERASIGGDDTLATNLPRRAAVRTASVVDHIEVTTGTLKRHIGQAPKPRNTELSVISPWSTQRGIWASKRQRPLAKALAASDNSALSSMFSMNFWLIVTTN